MSPNQLRCKSDSTKSQYLLLVDFKINDLEDTRLAGLYTIFSAGWLESLGTTILMQIKITVAWTTFQQFEARVFPKSTDPSFTGAYDRSPQVTETRLKIWQ